jgi:hypothetical protein
MHDETTFTVPDDLATVVPCQSEGALFTSPILDIDMDDDAWVGLSREDQFARLAAKEALEAKLVAACNGCPLLAECSNWAMSMGQEVFGVVGGLTPDDRPDHKNVPYITDYTERGPLGQVRDDLIDRWAKAGIPNKVIAERLGCNVRTVERRRAGLATGKTVVYTPDANDITQAPHAAEPAQSAPVDTKNLKILAANPDTAAKIPLLVQRLTDETAAIYDALMDGGFQDRSDIINVALPFVDRDQALSTAPKGRAYADDDAKVAVGARKFLMNRIDIGVRRGRIQMVVSDNGRVLICLEEDTANTWRAYRSQETVAA